MLGWDNRDVQYVMLVCNIYVCAFFCNYNSVNDTFFKMFGVVYGSFVV